MKENPKKEFYRRAEYFLDTQYENILFGYENRIKRVRRVYFWRNFLKILKNEDFGFKFFLKSQILMPFSGQAPS